MSKWKYEAREIAFACLQIFHPESDSGYVESDLHPGFVKKLFITLENGAIFNLALPLFLFILPTKYKRAEGNSNFFTPFHYVPITLKFLSTY